MKIIQQASISHDSALQLVTAAVNAAQDMQIAISACVINVHGRVLAKVSMDGASLIADELVEKKARTALSGLSSADFGLAVETLPAIRDSMLQLSGITLLGGGFPLRANGVVVGAFAVGGALLDQDIACAMQAMAALDL